MNKRFPAFTLIEIAIVLVIIGVLSTAVFKGQDILDSAKLRGVAQEFQKYGLAITMYTEQFNALPGDDPSASNHFGSGATNGNGSHVIEPAEEEKVWQHLQKGGFINHAEAPSSKIGGHYRVKYKPSAGMDGHWLCLSGLENKWLLSPAMALKLKAKFDEGDLKPSEGQLRVGDGEGQMGECLSGDGFNISAKSKSCIVYFKID